MSFKAGQQLKPSEVYYAAVGMFLSKGFKEVARITSNEVGAVELGRIFEKDNKLHALHFPAKDNDDEMSAERSTLPLSSVKAYMDVELSKKAFSGKHLCKHVVICESNHRKHFVYATQHVAEKANPNDVYWHLHDSKSKKRGLTPYDLTPIKKALLPSRGAVLFTPHYYGIQKDRWSCGYYSLLFMEATLPEDNQAKKKIKSFPGAITRDIVARFSTYYESACPTLPDAAEKEEAAEEEESVKIQPISDEAFFDEPSEGKASSLLKKAKSFFQRHRKTKYALIGLGIGLGLAVAGLALAFAWPVVLPAVGGLIAAHIAVGAMATATVGWLGVGALGLLTTAIVTGASLLTKWIKDKVSGAKPAAQPAAVSRRAQFESSYAKQEKVTRRQSVSLDTATVSSSLTTSSPLTRSKSSSDLSFLASGPKSQEELSLPEGVLKAMSKFPPSASQEEEKKRDEIAENSNGRKFTE